MEKHAYGFRYLAGLLCAAGFLQVSPLGASNPATEQDICNSKPVTWLPEK